MILLLLYGKVSFVLTDHVDFKFYENPNGFRCRIVTNKSVDYFSF